MLLDSLIRPKESIGGGSSQWLTEALGVERTHAGVDVTVESALSYSAVWAAVRVLTQSISGLPWHVYRKTNGGGGREIQDEHPIDWMIHREPNDVMSSVSFRDAIQTSALLYGNGYAEIIRDPQTNEPIAMIPLNPRGVKIDKVSDTGLVYQFYRDDASKPVSLLGENVFHVKGIGSGFIGYHLIERAKQSIGLGIAQETFGSTFFGNNARAGGFLKHPKPLDQTSKDNLHKSLKKKYGGPDKANRVWILDEGMDFVSNTISPDEAQFIGGRTYQIQDVSRWFGVPPHMLAEMSRATFSNIEHQGMEFVKYAVSPWLIRWEREADRKLFMPIERRTLYTRMNADALMRGDTKSRGEYYRTLWNMGAISINEIRTLEDMNPIGEDGDQRFVPLNMGRLGAESQGQQIGGGGASGDFSDSFYRIIFTATETLISKESRSVGRCRKSGNEYSEWIDKFYADHLAYIYSMLFPISQSFCELAHGELGSYDSAVKAFADRWVDDSKTDAITNGHKLRSTSQSIRKSVGWVDTRPQKLAGELLSVLRELAGISDEQKPETLSDEMTVTMMT